MAMWAPAGSTLWGIGDAATGVAASGDGASQCQAGRGAAASLGTGRFNSGAVCISLAQDRLSRSWAPEGLLLAVEQASEGEWRETFIRP